LGYEPNLEISAQGSALYETGSPCKPFAKELTPQEAEHQELELGVKKKKRKKAPGRGVAKWMTRKKRKENTDLTREDAQK
jgi:hypothetical protein